MSDLKDKEIKELRESFLMVSSDAAREQDRANKAEAARDRVRDLHTPVYSITEFDYCGHCGHHCPCPTIQTIKGDTKWLTE